MTPRTFFIGVAISLAAIAIVNRVDALRDFVK